MTITLDTATEQVLQRELDRGRFSNANDLIAHALELVGVEEAEKEEQLSDAEMEDWLMRDRDAVRAGIAESVAAKERGEGYSPEESRAILAQRRVERLAGRASTSTAAPSRLYESIAQAGRGEGFGEEELRVRMAARRDRTA